MGKNAALPKHKCFLLITLRLYAHLARLTAAAHMAVHKQYQADVQRPSPPRHHSDALRQQSMVIKTR
jgi:hypothetical protein